MLLNANQKEQPVATFPITMSYNEWIAIYRPLKNHLVPDVEIAAGCMFEIYGEELNHVLSIANSTPRKVWTLTDGDDDNGQACLFIVNGYHLVNRFGYVITEVEFNEADDIAVRDDS